MRPTIEKIRAKIVLDAWWKSLSEALWIQALEGRRRLAIEQRDSARVATLDKERLEPLSRPLFTRRRTRLAPSRPRSDHRGSNLRLREVTSTLRKELLTREF
jgi:hypothetical protein